LDFNKNLTEFIAQKSLGFSHGARLARKNIQEMIENKVAEMIIYKKVKEERIQIGIKKENILIS